MSRIFSFVSSSAPESILDKNLLKPLPKHHRGMAFLPLLVIAGWAAPAFLPLPCHHIAQAQSAEDEAEAEQDAMDAQKKAEARKERRRAAPPSALPGSETDEEDAGHARMDTNPTAALFDAVNRGSLNAVKEALNRGADINARNVLEQTPLDLAIDLGRNNIMFLLLSLRTYNPDGHSYGMTHGDITEHEGSGHINLNGKASTRQRSRAVVAPKSIIIDGGKPVPHVGFLGFGGPTMPTNTVSHPVHYPYKHHSGSDE